MKTVFYVLPSEQGEDILVSETLLDAESDIALLIERTDEGKDLYRMSFSTPDMQGPSEGIVERTKTSPLYFRRSSRGFDAVLPFESEKDALRFGYVLMEQILCLESMYDE